MTASGAHAADAPVLRVHGPSRLAFAGTTLALVTLASVATAALVNESTPIVRGPALPGLQALPPVVTGGDDAIVVDRAPGTWAPPRPVSAPAVRTVVEALIGRSGSDRLPPSSGSSATGLGFTGRGFTRTGLLPTTTDAPVAAPVVPVVPVALPRPKAPTHAKTPTVRPHVPSVTPSKVTEAVRKITENAAKAVERVAKKARRTAVRAKHDQLQIEDRRFAEQARHAREADRKQHKHGKHSA